MNANQIYQWQPIKIEKDLYSFLDLIDIDTYLPMSDNEKVELKYYTYHSFDGERSFNLFSVWFDNKPVMICQTAGRGGRDHRETFITDVPLYKDMVSYIRSLIQVEEDAISSLDPEEDCKDLTEFYGESVTDYYDPNLKPKIQSRRYCDV